MRVNLLGPMLVLGDDGTDLTPRGAQQRRLLGALAVAISVKLIDAAGNQFFLTTEGETYRWTQESKVVKDNTPAGEPVGLIHPAQFDAEYAAYVAAGVWPDGPPKDGKDYDPAVATSVYGSDGKVIWPAG